MNPQSRWIVSWTASAQGPYPIGSAVAQPDLSFAFPDAKRGARDQTFRLIVRPTFWGAHARLRFSNLFGDRALELGSVSVALHQGGGALIEGSNCAVTFDGNGSLTVPIGQVAWSDPVGLSFAQDPADRAMSAHRLAVSFHVEGESGPMTWHAKAMTTSYVSEPGAGATGGRADAEALPYSTTSWYFLDALEMTGGEDACAIVAFGDSITDGTCSTLNGDDRWPDVLARRLRARFGNRIAVVNAGIGGNQVVGPSGYSHRHGYRGGPPAVERLGRDVLSLSGVAAVIWLEGINDFSENGRASVEDVQKGICEAVQRMRSELPSLRVIGGTLVSALGSTNEAHGSALEDAKRRALNAFIRDSGVFDAVLDFDRATIDEATGRMGAIYVPNSTVGGVGDSLHPNRAGYSAMAHAIDLDALLGFEQITADASTLRGSR